MKRQKQVIFIKVQLSVWTIHDVKKRETAKKNNLTIRNIFYRLWIYCINQNT